MRTWQLPLIPRVERFSCHMHTDLTSCHNYLLTTDHTRFSRQPRGKVDVLSPHPVQPLLLDGIPRLPVGPVDHNGSILSAEDGTKL